MPASVHCTQYDRLLILFMTYFFSLSLQYSFEWVNVS